MDTNRSESRDGIPSSDTTIEELERRFSGVRGNPLMEELLATVKEYVTERQGENDR